MGWAKYCEDNISINNERIFRVPVKSVVYSLPQVESGRNVESERLQELKKNYTNESCRRGLELSFDIMPDKKTITKLRQNGWWWSKARSCWCNSNTTDNLKYVRTTFSGCPLHLIVVT